MVFKLAHASDLHLGYKSTRITNRQGINIRAADGYIAFSRMVDEMIAERVDAMLVSGDIFHIPTPDVSSIIFAQSQFRRLAAARIPVYMLAGNHDTNDVKADIAASRILNDPARRIFSEIEPYKKHQLADGIFVHMVSHHMYSEQHETMRQIRPVDGAVNIFATHGSIIDPILQIRLRTEQSPREVVIPDYLMSDYAWDYSLLGHIHERSFAGSQDDTTDTSGKRIYYNGSLIRRGFSDKPCSLGRGWTLWTIGEDGSFTPEFRQIAQRPQEDFPVIDAEGLNARELSEEIIQNLNDTRVGGGGFDPATAPILRQRVMNLDPAKQASLDWARINSAGQHALQWNLKVLSSLAPEGQAKDLDGVPLELPEIGDVVKAYDDWALKSRAMAATPEELRETVNRKTREFVELGQEVSLND